MFSESYEQFAMILFQSISSRCLDRQVAVELPQASGSGKLMFKGLEVCRAFYTYSFIPYIYITHFGFVDHVEGRHFSLENVPINSGQSGCFSYRACTVEQNWKRKI